MRREIFPAVLGMMFLLGGCPKRQPVSRVVYVPAAPSAQAEIAAGKDQGVLIIQEPQPPEAPVQIAAPKEELPSTAKVPIKKSPSVTKPGQTDNAADDDAKVSEPQPAELPGLETRSNPELQSALRAKLVQTQQQLQRRIDAMHSQQLARDAHRTLENARVFLTQSMRALEQNDLQRSQMLAEKADLLVSSLEK